MKFRAHHLLQRLGVGFRLGLRRRYDHWLGLGRVGHSARRHHLGLQEQVVPAIQGRHLFGQKESGLIQCHEPRSRGDTERLDPVFQARRCDGSFEVEAETIVRAQLKGACQGLFDVAQVVPQ